MNEADIVGTPVEKLQKTLSAGVLDDNAQRQGQRLLGRLNSSVRVAVLGLPGSGKSSVLNMLAGRLVLPEQLTLPTIELVYGEHEKTSAIMADASVQEFDGLNLEDATALDPAMIKVELPLPSLQKISLLEVVADGEFEDQKRALHWAKGRADIALWCTQDFNQGEQTLWADVPSVLKDHSFLVLTKADQFAVDGSLADRLDNLQEHTVEHFYNLVPIATLQALMSFDRDGDEAAQLFASSGGRSLVTEILRLVRDGRRADMDSVELFLHKYAEQSAKIETKAEIKTAPQTPDVVSNFPETREPQAVTPKAKDGPKPIPASTLKRVKPVPRISLVETSELEVDATPDDTEQFSELGAALKAVGDAIDIQDENDNGFETEIDPKPTPAADTPDPEVADAVPAPDEVAQDPGLDNALEYIEARAAILSKMLDDDPQNADMIDECIETIDNLTDLSSGNRQFSDFTDRCFDASDTLILMKTETGDKIIQEALTIVLQLKRELMESA